MPTHVLDLTAPEWAQTSILTAVSPTPKTGWTQRVPLCSSSSVLYEVRVSILFIATGTMEFSTPLYLHSPGCVYNVSENSVWMEFFTSCSEWGHSPLAALWPFHSFFRGNPSTVTQRNDGWLALSLGDTFPGWVSIGGSRPSSLDLSFPMWSLYHRRQMGWSHQGCHIVSLFSPQ